MQFTQYDLGARRAGDVVEVTLSGTEANVQLLDTPNLHAYQAGRQYRYYGGHFKQSPAVITVPRSGVWHVTVDLGGYGGSVDSSIRVLPSR